LYQHAPKAAKRGHILDATFDRVLDTFRAKDPEYTSVVARKLASLKPPFLFNPDVSTITAKEISLEQAIFAFGLEDSLRLV